MNLDKYLSFRDMKIRYNLMRSMTAVFRYYVGVSTFLCLHGCRQFSFLQLLWYENVFNFYSENLCQILSFMFCRKSAGKYNTVLNIYSAVFCSLFLSVEVVEIYWIFKRLNRITKIVYYFSLWKMVLQLAYISLIQFSELKMSL